MNPRWGLAGSAAGRTRGNIPAGTRGTVDIPVEVDYPATYYVPSGGDMLAKPNFGGVGEDNYWLTLKNGTFSVVGLANKLTQIGVDELKEGRQLAAMFTNFVPSGFTGNQFPWHQVQWMPVNYTESAENTACRAGVTSLTCPLFCT